MKYAAGTVPSICPIRSCRKICILSRRQRAEAPQPAASTDLYERHPGLVRLAGHRACQRRPALCRRREVDQLAFPEEPAGLADAAYEVLLHEFNLRHAEAELKWFQQEIFLQAQARGDLQSPAYLDALALTRDFGRWQAAVAPE